MAAATDNIGVVVRVMRQTAVYWAPLPVNDFGRRTFATPVEIACRWEDVQEEFLNAEGGRELSRAKLMVDRDLLVGGMLRLGVLADVADVDAPQSTTGAWGIRQFGKMPNFKGTAFLREVYV